VDLNVDLFVVQIQKYHSVFQLLLLLQVNNNLSHLELLLPLQLLVLQRTQVAVVDLPLVQT
jgi:hypothetical protein